MNSELADSKRKEREQRLARTRNKGRFRLAAIVIAIVGFLGGAIWVYQSDIFLVTSVKVSGAARLSEQEVVRIADVPEKATLLKLPTQAIERRVKSNPWVVDASVSRQFPHTVVIRVQERRPFAAVVVGRLAYLVDTAGVVLAAQPATMTLLPLFVEVPLSSAPLPSQRLTGREVENALAVLKALPAGLRGQVDRVYAKTVDDLRLVTKSGLEIVFGRAEQLDKKRFVIENLIKQAPKKIIYIDVKAPDAPTAKYAP
jgi:cell division protein FtsQ